MRIFSSELLPQFEYKLYLVGDDPLKTNYEEYFHSVGWYAGFVDAKDLGLNENVTSTSDIIVNKDYASFFCPYYIIKGNLYYLDADGFHLVDNSGGWTCVTKSLGICNGNLYALKNGTSTTLSINGSLPTGIEAGKWSKVTSGYDTSIEDCASFGINNGYLCSIYKHGGLDNTAKIEKLLESNNIIDIQGHYCRETSTISGVTYSDTIYGVALTSSNILYTLTNKNATGVLQGTDPFYPVSISGAPEVFYRGTTLMRQTYGLVGVESSNNGAQIYQLTPNTASRIGSTVVSSSSAPEKIVGSINSSGGGIKYAYALWGGNLCTISSVGVIRDHSSDWDNIALWDENGVSLATFKGRKIYREGTAKLILNNCEKMYGNGNGENYTTILALCKVNK